MTTLTTPRLVLRRYTEDDGALFHRLVADRRVFFWRDGTAGLAEAAAELRARLEALVDEGTGWWPVFRRAALEGGAPEAEAFLGQVVAQPLTGTDRIEIGYHFRPEAWGHGYATEAAGGVIGHIFATTGIDPLAAIVLPDNRRSLGVVERLGFAAKGEGLYGTLQLHHRYFELTRADFAARAAARAAAGETP